MLRNLTAMRLLPQRTIMLPLRRVLVSRPIAPCSWSKRDEILSNWEALRANPSEWYDNRDKKTNPKAPDFVNKADRSLAIWIESRDVPDSYGQILDEVDAQKTGGVKRGLYDNDANAPETTNRRDVELANWESLRDYPDEWYDNRNNKTNPRAPDFRRKDDRYVALWIESYNAPAWIGQLLQYLDDRQAQRTNGYGQEQRRGQQAPQAYTDDKRVSELAKWELLRSNPELWFDNRRSKTNPKAPDFKLKSDRTVALWLTSYNLPEYINDLVDELDARNEQRQSGQLDYQANPGGGYADYSQQQQSGGGTDPREEELMKWESLRNNPEQWFDNRYSKPNPKSPDFRRKDDRNAALWLSSRMLPEWFDTLVPELDARHKEREAARSANNVMGQGY